MKLLYTLGIYGLGLGIKIGAYFNAKLKQGYVGRKETFEKLRSTIHPKDKTFWFHCASLGEYEQGLPVFEALKSKFPEHKVVLSFFSPSGYEIKKNTEIADVVVYMPLDTKSNAIQFLDIVNPDHTIFVKYEIWPNVLNELKKRKHKAILISAVFRKKQLFFKWYAGFMKKSLFAFQHIFTQDENSKALLNTIGYSETTVSGDTRFDRVSKQLEIDNSVPFIEDFINRKTCIVFGSTWPDDDKLFIDYINNNSNGNVKYIIAPHHIKSTYTNTIKKQLNGKVMSYSEKKVTNLKDYDVFILDTIGYLNRVYSYADIAYVGGGAGTTGLHNILEPAVFGIPIIIGKNYAKFPEAKTLIELGGVVSVADKNEFEQTIHVLIENGYKREEKGQINGNFIQESKGAVHQIIDYIVN